MTGAKENEDKDDAAATPSRSGYAQCGKFASAHSKAISALSFSPCGEMLASSSADGLTNVYRIKISESEMAEIVQSVTLTGHSQGVNDVAWTADSTHVITAGDDKILKFWDVETGKCVVDLKGHSHFVFSCCVNGARGDVLSSGSFDELVKLWDVRRGSEIRSLAYHTEPVTSTSFCQDGSTIASASHDGYIRLCDVGSGACVKHFYAQGHPPAGYVCFSPNSQFLLVSTLDSKIRLWRSNMDAHSLNPAKIYSGHSNQKYCIPSTLVLRSKSGRYVASGSEDSSVYLWDVQTLQIAQKLQGHRESVLGLSEHPVRAILASGGMEGDICLWKENTSDSQ